MSARCMGWAFALQEHRSIHGVPFSPTQQLVLLTLADHYNGSRDCAWPSQATIVRRTGLSERALRNALEELERIGIIAREPWLNEKRRKVGNIYRFPLYDDMWTAERIAYDFPNGQYDRDVAAENDDEMGTRYEGQMG